MTATTAVKGQEDLLEQTYADDRGVLYEPRQTIYVESFDACFPVRVYPNGTDVGSGVGGRELAIAEAVGYSV